MQVIVVRSTRFVAISEKKNMGKKKKRQLNGEDPPLSYLGIALLHRPDL